MSQQVQDLINKIKSEGVEAAEKRARAIEAEAHERAKTIVVKAKQEADKIIDDAKDEAVKLKESAEKAIRQAARDTTLVLKKEIQTILNKIILHNVNQSLSPEQLNNILGSLIQKFFESDSATDIKIMVNPADLESLKGGLISRFQEQLKTGVQVSSSEDISRGFAISFDGGKSSFEFTDAALAEYLSAYLNPEISAIIRNGKD